MKKAVFFFILVIVCHLAMAQLDTLGKYPYLYHYNWPETGIMHDSLYCTATLMSADCPPDEAQFWYDNYTSQGVHCWEYEVQQHLDEPTSVIGIAVGYGTGRAATSSVVSLFDSSMSEMVNVVMSSSYYTWPLTDTNWHQFKIPGYDQPNQIYTNLYYLFFEKSVVVSGDYYMRIAMDPADTAILPPALIMARAVYLTESHNAPYNFPLNRYRINIEGVWDTLRTSRSYPMLFLIIDPPCHAVDSMEVEVGADGCLRVSWEKPKLQSQWMVSLVADGGGEILQPTDTNYWEYCNLTPGRRYTVRLRSRCDNLYSHSWSDWGEPVSFGENHGIEAVTEPEVSVVPNPAADRVAVRCCGRMTAVEVVDALGRTVLTIDGGGNEATLDVSALPTGLYTVLVTTPQGRTARHLTIAR